MMIPSRNFAPSFPVSRACGTCHTEAKAQSAGPAESVTLSGAAPPAAGPPTAVLAEQGLKVALFAGGSQCFAACPIHTGNWCDSTLAAHGVKHRCPMGHSWGLGE